MKYTNTYIYIYIYVYPGPGPARAVPSHPPPQSPHSHEAPKRIQSRKFEYRYIIYVYNIYIYIYIYIYIWITSANLCISMHEAKLRRTKVDADGRRAENGILRAAISNASFKRTSWPRQVCAAISETLVSVSIFKQFWSIFVQFGVHLRHFGCQNVKTKATMLIFLKHIEGG